MQQEATPSFLPYLSQRFHTLVWTCLDSDLTKSAVFYAERYFAMNQLNHDARHLYATTLLRAGQTHSAMCLIDNPPDMRCSGCLEIKAKCCTALGRYRQAREALEESLQDTSYTPTQSMSSRTARAFPEEAALRCRSGTMALKGNLPEKASLSFRQALALNPMLWEAFEGLCALGSFPEIDELFPPKSVPVKRTAPEEQAQLKPAPSIPTATGAGFFTPDVGSIGNSHRGWKPEPQAPQPFRMGPPPLPRDSLAANDTSIFPADNSFLQVQAHLRPSRTQATVVGSAQATTSRPLSSADEAGPVHKKLRSAVRKPSAEVVKSKTVKSIVDEPLKKARARPALKFANFFSSSGRRSQPVSSTRTTLAGKSERPVNSGVPIRRSTRLMSNANIKPASKHPPLRERRRVTTRSRLAESENDEEALIHGEVPQSTSPHSNAAQSPRSDVSPAPSNWTAGQEQAAQEAYDVEMADHYVYELMRRFASATRALSMFDSRKCLLELEKLPLIHQNSPWVLAMVGRAHYERLEYASAERAFKAVRSLEPFRMWDMEVYSTLLWHLQQNVQLSYLAQELLSINPQSPQAWIAVGNLFSLQKERSQALTCFRRAAQLDPSCAYAYTLSGHESIDEDLDKAIGFFQSALRTDPRHYNAWYGLGTCYLRMSKIRLAEYHYRKAVEIHPNNAVLLGCVGMAVERRGDKTVALSLFDQAVRLSPDNALVRYRRAKILISLKRYSSALQDLELLRDSSPEESNVVFQLAKVYRLIGDEVKSAHWLAVARDISPKSVNKIKKLIETAKDEEEDDPMDEG